MALDLTVAAVPAFFATIVAERRYIDQHREEQPELERGRYLAPDTRANLIMGTASLVAPYVAGPIVKKVAIGSGRGARYVGALAALGFGTAIVADGLARRERRRAKRSAGSAPTTPPVAEPNAEASPELATYERVGGIGAAVGLSSSLVLVSTTWHHHTSTRALWNRRRFDLGDGVAAWGLAMIGWDLIYYWNHRFMHESRYMWAVHEVHHSSEHYNLAVALRQPVFHVLGTFVPEGLLAYLGVAPRIVAHSRSINLLYQYWIHTEVIRSIGWAQGIFNSPADHRVHHGTAPASIDRNHGGILSIWDRMFGTFQPELEQQVYGLTTNLDTFSPWTIATHEYRAIIEDIATSTTWRERLSVVFRGPGYAIERRKRRQAEAAESDVFSVAA